MLEATYMPLFHKMFTIKQHQTVEYNNAITHHSRPSGGESRFTHHHDDDDDDDNNNRDDGHLPHINK